MLDLQLMVYIFFLYFFVLFLVSVIHSYIFARKICLVLGGGRGVFWLQAECMRADASGGWPEWIDESAEARCLFIELQKVIRMYEDISIKSGLVFIVAVASWKAWTSI